MVNLELYRVFYTVARCGSLTKAAEELYISQPAVSQAVKQLENQLGFAKNELGVPLSNGGILVDPSQKKEWEMVDHRCKQAVVGRARGTTERPKSVKSPFRDNIGEINKDYAAHRAAQLQGR